MTGYGAAIFPQHAKLLEESAVLPEVAAERGYVSVDVRSRLAAARFASSQRVVPGLLIPIRGTDGTVRLHQYRLADQINADSLARLARNVTTPHTVNAGTRPAHQDEPDRTA